MAKKIRTFSDYDAARREREFNLPQAIESKLEQKIRINIKKEERELGGVAIIAHPADFLKVLFKGPEEMIRLYLEQQGERHTPQAEQETQLDYFQQNMRELIGCGVSISKPHTSLEDSQQQSFYARFLDNVKELTDSKHFAPFKLKYSGVEDLLMGFHPPQKGEERFESLIAVTEGLCRERHITRENADTIVRLLSPRPERQTLPARTSPARGRTPAPKKSTYEPNHPASTADEVREYLSVVLRLPKETADSYADKVTLLQLCEFHQGLYGAVGAENAQKLIQHNPGLVLYPSENIFTKYLTTLQVVQGRIRSNGDQEKLGQEFGLGSNVEKYASLEQLLELKRKLFQGTGNYQTIDPPEAPSHNFQVYVSRYALLKRNPAMEPRLDSLVRTGELLVGEHEHWSGEGTTAGPRGRDILKKIRTELNHLFTDLGYGSPECEINFGQHTLAVPPRTQQLLGQIRDRAYQSPQKEK